MAAIIFSFNWNNKLDNKAFTTIRLRNDSLFKEYEVYEIFHNSEKAGVKHSEFKGLARIESIKNIYLSQVNSFISFLDTGYSVDEFTKLVKTMYKNRVKDWTKQQLSLILLVKEGKK